MSKHTPGPWKVAGGPSWEETEACYHIVDSKKGWVAQLWNKYEEDFKSREESKANARLIAAAPEMLEALEKVKEYIEHSMNYGILAGVPEFVESAIKKARGGENKLEEAEEDLEEDLEGFIEEYNEQHVDDFAPGDGKPFEYSQQWEEC